jgi:hypothetical protein
MSWITSINIHYHMIVFNQKNPVVIPGFFD